MTEYEAVLAQAEQLYDMADINRALDKMAQALTDDYQAQNPVVLCVMNGAVVTTGHLLPRLLFRLELDYIHASRYGDETTGGKLVWQSQPRIDLRHRHVLLVEDIFDEGVTLTALRKYCQEAGAASVRCACLLNKIRENKESSLPEYLGLEVPDRYVFGFGLDMGGYWRNLPAIYAVRESGV